MKFISLNLCQVEELLNLQGQMYFREGKWKELWDKEAKGKFKVFIKDYLTNFPQGCFGLENKGELIGAMFLMKIAELKPIPYLHKVTECLKPKGQIAYVSVFVVKKGKNETEIAEKLYQQAEIVALKVGCKTIEVVINISPLEEQILKENNYKRMVERFTWEIYPGMKVPCWIYYQNLQLDLYFREKIAAQT